MKTNLLFLLLLFLSNHIFSQDRKDKNDKVWTLKFTKIPIGSYSLPFSGVEVIDARFDQTKIGYTMRGVVFSYGLGDKYDVVFPDSLKSYLPQIFKKLFDFDKIATDTLMILIKKFRINEYLHITTTKMKQRELIFTLSASFYAKHNDRYYKMSSVDDIFVRIINLSNKSPLNEPGNQDYVIGKMIQEIIKRQSFTFDTLNISFTYDEIKNAVEKRFQLPGLTASKPAFGVYMSFNEFRQNNPSIKDISLIYDKGALISFKSNSENTLQENSFWGVSDGEKVFVYFRKNYYKLIHCGNSFKILAYRTYREKRGKTNLSENILDGEMLLGVIMKTTEKLKDSEYFDIDMENGELLLEEILGTFKAKKAKNRKEFVQ